MPLITKTGGAWNQLLQGDVHVNDGGAMKAADQVFVKDNGVWVPMFESLTQPRWGYASYAGPTLSDNGYLGAQSFIEENLTTLMASDADNLEFTYDLPDGQTYAYFAHPKSLGLAVFTDTVSSFAGAWDGAKWLEDLSNMDETGPIEVTFDAGNGPEQWYVYRTDWSGPSSEPTTFRVEYPNRS
tara:strand:- start:61484 stop:62035 length:552 start_codon:yes stop_codon:yes gene_type:complete